MVWANNEFSFGGTLPSQKMTNLQNNFAAVASGYSGAPRIMRGALLRRTMLVTSSGLIVTSGVQAEFSGLPSNLRHINASFRLYVQSSNNDKFRGEFGLHLGTSSGYVSSLSWNGSTQVYSYFGQPLLITNKQWLPLLAYGSAPIGNVEVEGTIDLFLINASSNQWCGYSKTALTKAALPDSGNLFAVAYASRFIEQPIDRLLLATSSLSTYADSGYLNLTYEI